MAYMRLNGVQTNEGDTEQAFIECKAYMAYIRQKYGKEPFRTMLIIKSIGTNMEVGINFDELSNEAVKFVDSIKKGESSVK